jgi:hypothetical protein
MRAQELILWLESACRVTNSNPEVKVSLDDCEDLKDITDVQINTSNFLVPASAFAGLQKTETILLITERP